MRSEVVSLQMHLQHAGMKRLMLSMNELKTLQWMS